MCYSAVVTFCYVENNSNTHAMDDAESISVLSEGTAAVNTYGSIIGDHEETGSGAIEDRVYCDCKGQCAKKKGKGACKCREGNLTCHDLCACDKAKCKNKAAVGDATEVTERPRAAAVSDGELHFQHELQDTQNEIKEFVATLDPVKKDNILVHLLTMGRGGLDFAKKLADEDPNDPEPPPEETPEWCKCRVCVPMPSEEENVCCKRLTCITSYTSFANICLDRDILEVCRKARCDIRADEFNFSMESFRNVGYRQFALWRYGKLGRGNRKVIPACAVHRIRIPCIMPPMADTWGSEQTS